MTMPPVVVGVDDSVDARSAVLWAAEEAMLARTSLLVVHSPALPLSASGRSPGRRAARVRRRRPFGAGCRDRSRPGQPAAGCWCRGLLSHADPIQALIDVSAEAQLLVLGSRTAAMGDMSMLSSKRVLVSAHAHCPVLLLGPVSTFSPPSTVVPDRGRRRAPPGPAGRPSPSPPPKPFAATCRCTCCAWSSPHRWAHRPIGRNACAGPKKSSPWKSAALRQRAARTLSWSPSWPAARRPRCCPPTRTAPRSWWWAATTATTTGAPGWARSRRRWCTATAGRWSWSAMPGMTGHGSSRRRRCRVPTARPCSITDAASLSRQAGPCLRRGPGGSAAPMVESGRRSPARPGHAGWTPASRLPRPTRSTICG